MRSRRFSLKLRSEQLERRLVLDAQFSDLITLQQHATGTAVDSPVEVVSSDLDGDGDGDVAVLSETHLSWHENLDGQGTFGEHQLIGLLLGERNAELLATDIDSDGDNDLIVAHAEGLELFVNISELGAGTIFIARTHVPVNGPHGLVTADLDLDGDVDLLSGTADGELLWIDNEMVQSGSLKFGTRLLAQVGDVQAGSPERFLSRLADVDSDGDEDIVYVSTAGEQVGWIEKLGDAGQFSGEPTIISSGVEDATSLDVADFDGDSYVDVVVATPDRGAVWFRNSGADGGFEEGVPVHAQAEAVRAADLDEDGDAELLIECGRCAVWIENVGTSQPFGPVHDFETGLSEVTSLTTADLNGDGYLDIVFASKEIDRVAWLENDAESPEFLAAYDIALGIQRLVLVEPLDVDNDGDLDLVVMDDVLNLFIYEYQSATNSFAQPQLHRELLLGPGQRSLRTPRLTDLDRDGVDDLVIQTHAGLFWFERIPGESLAFEPPRTIEGDFDGWTLADVDFDSDLDVVAMGYAGDFNWIASWFELDAGDDRFIERGRIIEKLDQLPVWRMTDMDGDGDLDLYVGTGEHVFAAVRMGREHRWNGEFRENPYDPDAPDGGHRRP